MNKSDLRWVISLASILLVIMLGNLLASCITGTNFQSGLSQTSQVKRSTTVLTTVTLAQQETPSNPADNPGSPAAQPTRIPPVCESTQGATLRDELYSKTFDRTIPFLIYIPPCEFFVKNQTILYPTLYLLHGLGGDENQWINLGLDEELDSAVLQGSSQFIVVMPQIPDIGTWPSDSNAIFMTEELIPMIEAQYPAQPDKEHRAIGGLSRGAAWALRIGLTHPEYFQKIGLHSLPLFDNEVNHWVSVLRDMSPSEIPQLFIDSGRNDQDLGSVILFNERLQSLNINYKYHLFEGNHDEKYWSENLPIYLEWYAQGW